MKHVVLAAIALGKVGPRAARLACAMLAGLDTEQAIPDPRARRRARAELRAAGLLPLIDAPELQTLPLPLAQAVAAEAAARIARGTVRNRAAYLRALIDRAQNGQFRQTVNLEPSNV